MKKKMLLILVLLLSIMPEMKCFAYQSCDYSTIARLKSLVTNVNISYDYYVENNMAYFNVTIMNVPENVYFIDSNGGNSYNYSNTNNGEITIYNYVGKDGYYSFYLDFDGCQNKKLGTKYYRFPNYNTYYENELCTDIPEFSLCQKWAKVNYGYEEFEKLVYEYKNKEEKEEEIPEIEYKKTLLDIVIDFYIKNYLFLLGGVIIICGIALVIKLKKDKFNL